MISKLLAEAQRHLEDAEVHEGIPFSASWTSHMTASMVLASLATAYMEARDVLQEAERKLEDA
jgi:hypothetical protein